MSGTQALDSKSLGFNLELRLWGLDASDKAIFEEVLWRAGEQDAVRRKRNAWCP